MAGSPVESALRDGAAAVKLIETLRYDGGYSRLPLHLARLERSARQLGWGCNTDRVRAALESVTSQARVRLTLDAQGQVAVTTSPLPAQMTEWRIGLAPQRLTSGDPWLSLKSSHRPAYDAARAQLATGLDEVVFQNERGEVCDGTITTLFFDRGQGMRTPPLKSGLLPGVLRAELLAGECREEVLLAGDVTNVRLWVGNSLRGLLRAIWVEKPRFLEET